MSIIAINGYKGSGKDTVTKIIQILFERPTFTNEAVQSFLKREWSSEMKNKKFADLSTKVYKLLTGIDYDKLPRDKKEYYRPDYIGFVNGHCKNYFGDSVWVTGLFRNYISESKWIISDLRFQVELDRILEEEKLVLIKITRPEYCSDCPFDNEQITSQTCKYCNNYTMDIYLQKNETEIELDYFEDWDFIIDNNGTLLDLIQKVRELLPQILNKIL